MSSALDTWVDQLTTSGLPAFARTVREVAHVATDQDSSARDLSEVVSRDAAMTARIIQIANSSMFNLQNREVDTVSSAVVMMGFDAVKELAISISLIDQMTKGRNHARVTHTMARAFHAAAHANSLARAVEADAREETFVAALLKDVGDLAFWGSGDEVCEELDRAFNNGSPEEAEQDVLGFRLNALSARLAQQWNLGDLARRCHDNSRQSDPAVSCIVNAHRLAEAIEIHGWPSDQVKQLVAELAAEMDIDHTALQDTVAANVDQAAEIADKFGVDIRESLPIIQPAPADRENSEGADTQAKATKSEAGVEKAADVAVQMEYLGRIAAGIEDNLGRDELMDILVRGVDEGLGGTLCYFMLLTPDRQSLVVKYSTSEYLTGTHFKLEVVPHLEQALSGGVPVRVATESSDIHQASYALAGGIHIANKAVGVLLLERSTDFGEADVNVFRQFSQQVGLVLTS